MQTALECLFGICARGHGMSEPIYEELTLWGERDQRERLGQAEIPREGLGVKHSQHNGLQRKTLSYRAMQTNVFIQVYAITGKKKNNLLFCFQLIT